MSALHPYQSVMNRMENVSYLVLPTCASSDGSAAALKSIRDCTFPLYRIPTHILFWQGKHSTVPHHRCRVIFKCSQFRGLFDVYVICVPCMLACENYMSGFHVCVCRTSDCETAGVIFRLLKCSRRYYHRICPSFRERCKISPTDLSSPRLIPTTRSL